jgi:GntR family transcriptional regulator
MLVNLKNISNLTLQEQIVSEIRSMILSERLEPHSALDSIRKFASQNKVSVITVQRAYETLENEGLIYSRKGKGFFINEIETQKLQNIAEEYFKNSLKPLIDNAFKDGLSKDQIKKISNEMINNKY